MKKRAEHDSMGEILVDCDKLWGAQTQRSFQNFKIGDIKIPYAIIEAIALVKKSAAMANFDFGKLDKARCDAICAAVDKILLGGYKQHFPLVVWQTGSGTQTNMNVNEVIAHLCDDSLAIHPNDHVNMSQSTNDVFPTAIHIAAAKKTVELKKQLKTLIETLGGIEAREQGVIKIGRTHLQDATPVAFSAEVSGWRAILETAIESLDDCLKYIYRLPIGGTAVGSGINAPQGFGKKVSQLIAQQSQLPFVEAENKYHGLSAKDGLCLLSGALKNLAAGLMKIANDVRWLASGPRAGLGEVLIPENEPGSSIMPGKVNPTQCEALTMIAAEVMGNDVAVGIAASQGNFELNVYMPLIGFKIDESLQLLADGICGFNKNCMSGLVANRAKMRENVEKSLMLATALSPIIGYDKSAEIVKKAHKEGSTLKQAAIELGYIDSKTYDEIIEKSLKV